MYRSIKESIPDDYYTLEIGKAKLIQDGSQLCIITYGMGVHWAKEIVDEMPERRRCYPRPENPFALG